MREVCAAAVDAATAAGAEYADARVVVKRNQLVATKNGRVERLTDSESEGVGVRVLVGGAWGFACDRRLTAEGARDAALRACGCARRRVSDAELSERARRLELPVRLGVRGRAGARARSTARRRAGGGSRPRRAVPECGHDTGPRRRPGRPAGARVSRPSDRA